MILVKLLLAHFIGDFVLQPKSWVEKKASGKLKSPEFYLHILVHGILIFFLLWELNFWWLALLLMLIHGLIDALKMYWQRENSKNWWFLFDQLLHISSILVVWALALNQDQIWLPYLESPALWIYCLALIFLSKVGSFIMRIVMNSWSQSLSNYGESLLNAGTYIGILERLFVFTFVVTGHWDAIGFLLASKSVFRFGDLKESKDRMLTEYILIGTMVSFGLAIVTGLLVLNFAG